MIVDNLSNPGAPAASGDVIRTTHRSGPVVTKSVFFFDNAEVAVEADITKLAWMRLFTLAELAEIKALAETDTMMAVFLDMLGAAETILLSSPATVAALDYLQATGKIDAKRRTEIESYQYQIEA